MGTRTDERFWTVYLISDGGHCQECDSCGSSGDPDRSPGDFAYTHGLHERGLPELHLWARPSEGDDPGEDWKFSARDLHAIANELAADVVGGRLSVGDQVHRTYDGGGARVTFRLGEPVAPEAVDAWRADPGARVVPVRWSLEREPAGRLASVSPEVVQSASALIAELRTPRPARVLRGWWAGTDVGFGPAQHLGPLSPLVRAHAAHLLGADVDRTARVLVELACGYGSGMSVGWVLTLATSAARTVGRQRAVLELRDEVPDLVEAAWHHPDAASWGQVVRRVVDTIGDWETAAEDLARLWHQGVLAALVTAAVHDVAGPELLCAGLGPVRWASTTWADAPVEHLAPRAAHRTVARLLGAAGPVHQTVQTHRRSAADESYRDALAHLQGRMVVSRVALGPLDLVLPPEVQLDLATRRLLDDARSLAAAWVAAVASAETVGEEFLDALCAPYDGSVPELRATIFAAREARAS